MEFIAAGTILYILFILGIFLFGFISLAFWIWMLIDCLTNESDEGNDKLTWVLVLIFTNWIGALIYYFVRRPERKKTAEQASLELNP